MIYKEVDKQIQFNSNFKYMMVLAVILLAIVVTAINADTEIKKSKNNWRRVHNPDSFKSIDYDDQIENKEEELNTITYFKDKKNIIATSKSKQKNKTRSKRPYVNEELDENRNFKEIKTTCAEFSENSYFHPKEIFYKTWVSFYKWTTHVPNGYIAKFYFKIPRRKLIYKLKDIYKKYSKEHINWKLPKFSMMLNNEYFLIIANDKTGGFDVLMEHSMDSTPQKYVYNIRVPKMRMKIVGPYLVIMFCGYPSTMVFACLPEGHIPLFVNEAALSIGIIGGHGTVTRFKSSDFANTVQ